MLLMGRDSDVFVLVNSAQVHSINLSAFALFGISMPLRAKT
mgnify:FL=1